MYIPDHRSTSLHSLTQLLAGGLSSRVMGFTEFISTFLSHYLDCAFSRFHLELAGRLQHLILSGDGGAREDVLAPRGNAKSTIVSLALVLWVLCEELKYYTILTSDTYHQGIQLLRHVREEIETNAELRAHYPAARPGKLWRDEALCLANGRRVDALGVRGRIRGRRHGEHRPDLLIVDDPEDDDAVLSPLQRERALTWFDRALMKSGSPKTDTVVVGTALHAQCLVMMLRDRPGWRSTTYQAIIKWPDRMDLWERWEEVYFQAHLDHADPDHAATVARHFYDHNQAVMDAGAEVLWPERESLYDLMVMRANEGHMAFASEKQNVCVNPSDCEWPESYFEEHIYFDRWPACQLKVMALDPSKGRDSQRGDYSAIVWLGVALEGSRKILYVEADLARRSTDQLVKDVVRRYHQVQPEGLLLETNAWQELLSKPLEQEAAELGLTNFTVYPVEHNTPKKVRIRRLGQYLARGELRFMRRPSRGDGLGNSTKLLVNQLRYFPVADHDDGPDALEMALRLAIWMYNASGTDNLGNRLNLGI